MTELEKTKKQLNNKGYVYNFDMGRWDVTIELPNGSTMAQIAVPPFVLTDELVFVRLAEFWNNE